MEQNDWLENRYNSIGKSWEDIDDIKDKVIDEMTKELRHQFSQQGDLYCVDFCENEKKCNIDNCIKGIKQYFYKKVRNEK